MVDLAYLFGQHNMANSMQRNLIKTLAEILIMGLTTLFKVSFPSLKIEFRLNLVAHINFLVD